MEVFQMNIILIGMPGAGKSTIGVVLAKTLGYEFVDTDLIIQQREGRLLQELIDSQGMETFLDMESRAVTSVDCDRAIIATGGSVIFREAAMKHLQAMGKVIFLDVPYDEIERRVSNITTRGIAISGGATLKDVYKQRYPYYMKYHDFKVDCMGKHVEDIVNEVVEIINSK